MTAGFTSRTFHALAAAVALLAAAANHADEPNVPLELEWVRLPDLPDTLGYAGAFAGVSNDALIVAGGTNFPDAPPWENGTKTWYDRAYVLDHMEGRWRTGYRLPRPLAYGVSVSTDDGIVMAGGCDADRNHREVYRVAWRDGELHVTDLPPLPEPVSCAAGALVGDRFYIAGGQPHPNPFQGPSMRNFWVLDLTEREPAWQVLAPWPGPERFYAVAASDGKAFYLISGLRRIIDDDGHPKLEYLRDMYRYVPPPGGEPGEWERLTDLPRPNGAAPTPAPIVKDRYLLLLGNGADGSHIDLPIAEHPGFGDELLAYDTREDRWIIAGRVPRARAAVTAAQWNGWSVVPTGEERPGVRTPRVDAVRVGEQP